MEVKRLLIVIVCLIILSSMSLHAQETTSESGQQIDPWCGKYPLSFFVRARTANTVGKGRLLVSNKFQYFDWDKVKGPDGDHHSRPSGQEKTKILNVLTTKYGWAEDHHIALGIPYLINDFDLNGSTNDSHGLGNIFVFEKWNFIKETNSLPGVAVDFWYFFPTGNTSRKLGTDDSAFRITTEVSKAWKYFSLHFNPGYSWGQNNLEIGEINAALLLKPFKTIWPALEYNYLDKKNSGHAHDLVPGVIWKFKPSWSFKAGIPINLDTTFMDRDRVGFVCKLSKKW